MVAVIDTSLLILQILSFAVLLHVILHWLFAFGVLERHNPYVSTAYNSLESLLEPIYRPLRNFLPKTQFDLGPLAVLIAIFFLQRLIGVDLRGALGL